MARAAKQGMALTPEEKLARALVPMEEQPYEVPENWCWTRIQFINQYAGSSIDPSAHPDTVYELYSVPSSADNYPEVVTGIEIGSTKQAVEKDDVLLCKINPRINRVWKVSKHTDNALLASSEWIIIRNNRINPDYLMYCFRTTYFREYMLSKISGVGGSLMRAQPKYVQSYPVPIPPFAEQQRIVDRIESLFAKLDEAKEKAQAVVDGFEDRKAAILHKAFRGKLTDDWRSEHQIDADSWYSTTVGECSKLITKGASPRWQGVTYTDDKSQTLFVTSENVREGFLDWTKEKYLDNAINDIQKRSILHRGDVLINIVGASIGRSAIFDRDCLANTNQAVCIVRVKGNLLNKYLCHYFNSPFALTYYNENKVETARANISLTNISDMPINLPSLQEQQEIVRRLDGFINREMNAKAVLEQILAQIDTMKKAILARAFRGELGTNDPADESAEELLKRIL